MGKPIEFDEDDKIRLENAATFSKKAFENLEKNNQYLENVLVPILKQKMDKYLDKKFDNFATEILEILSVLKQSITDIAKETARVILDEITENSKK